MVFTFDFSLVTKRLFFILLIFKTHKFLSMKLHLYAYSLLLAFSLVTTACKTAENNAALKRETVDNPLKIMVISDLNASYGSTEYPEDVPHVISQIDSIKPDIILCAGDMVAGQKASLTGENIKAMWASFKTTVLDPIQTSKIPFGFTVGNHDASPTFALDRRLAQEFWMQNAAAVNLTFVDSTHFPFYFSYIKNGVFFISWDAAGAQIPAEVYSWMKEQLQSRAAQKARLRLLLGHLPLYPIVEAKNKPGEVNAAPDSALAFFQANGIDVYISGHQHAFFPAQKKGVRLFNAGAIGNGPRPLMGHDSAAKKAFHIIEVPVKNAARFTHQTYLPISNTIIDARSLPDSIKGFNGVLYKEQ